VDSFFSAYSALEARMKLVDIATNNLANAQTTGFKRDFAHIMENGDNIDVNTRIDLSVGDLINTGNGTDAAIDGEGFFAVETPNGVRYTRDGSFTVNTKGELVTKDGSKVLSTDDRPVVSSDGMIGIQDGGLVTAGGSEMATLKIVTFRDASRLLKEGSDRFQWTGAPNQVQNVPEPRVKGAHLERSNVNPISEMVHLMAAYREFETVQRTVKTLTTDLNARLIQELGRLG